MISRHVDVIDVRIIDKIRCKDVEMIMLCQQEDKILPCQDLNSIGIIHSFTNFRCQCINPWRFYTFELHTFSAELPSKKVASTLNDRSGSCFMVYSR